MRNKDRETRRQRIQALEQAEAKARCSWCRKSLREVERVLESILIVGRFCSEDCIEDAKDSEILGKPKPRGFQRVGS